MKNPRSGYGKKDGTKKGAKRGGRRRNQTDECRHPEKKGKR